jgi:hypothetical protein
MFDQLLESEGHRRQPLGAAALALVLHGAVLGAVLHHPPAAPATPPIEIAILPLPSSPQNRADAPRPPAGVVQQDPIPIFGPPDIPPALPPVNIARQPFDPRQFFDAGQGPAAPDLNHSIGAGGSIDHIVATEAADEAPTLLTAGPRQLPPELRGIPARVEARFVVDTTGRAEPASWQVVQSTNAAFEEPARNMIMRSIFRPGRLAGRAVPVQVQQVIAFEPE